MSPRFSLSIAAPSAPPRGAEASRRGSVLVIVLVTIVFATTALLAFIERAGDELLVEARVADAGRLRAEAYSALETTLAVLEDFRQVGGSLRSPAEGWTDPLGWSGYAPIEGRTVEVTFLDESGKIPLANVEYLPLVAFFVNDGLTQNDAERLADALLGWMRADYVPTTAGAPRVEDYERSELPFAPPVRSLRSFEELRSIDVARELFFDESGRPTELYDRFAAAFSLYRYPRPNLNTAPDAVLAAVGTYSETQIRQLADFRAGAGSYAAQGPGYFRAANDAALVLGEQTDVSGFAVQIRALRITVTVREGRSSFQLSAVIAPPNGATPIPGLAAASASGSASESAPSAGTATTAAGTNASLNYPFTLLEITENAAMSVTVPAAAATN